MGELRVMTGKHGDVRTVWATDDPASTAVAKRTFDDAKRRGMMLFSLGADGRHGQVLTEFDPTAAQIVATPPIAGG